MTDPISCLAGLRRPRLMIRAARLGVADYRRERDLRRLLQGMPSASDILDALIDAEARAEAVRKAGDATYNIARHIELLIALLAEARSQMNRA